jgi:cytochrome c5
MRRKTAVLSLTLVLFIATGLLVACAGSATTQTTQPEEEQPATSAPSNSGAVLLEERCTTCHGLDRTTQAQKTGEEWEETVSRMVSKGAQLSEEEQAVLVEYLAQNYGP